MRELILLQNFIMATRDSGYKNTASAVAELIDNSLEAEATTIEINIIKTDVSGDNEFLFHIIDNGRGMSPTELNQALQFGGSSKFNSRRSLGRYGMGLPNSSLSQARRVEVITWKSPASVYRCYLDADEVSTGKIKILPKPEKVSANEVMIHSDSGTMVKWLKCDRISNKNLKTLIKNLHFELGRVFRHHIWEGKKITINNELILPVDPLFLRSGMNIMGAVQYGKPLKYEVKIPGSEASSEVTVRFVELPLEEWTKYSNEEKNKLMLSKWAGVSILRANREIDYGWYFMGGKRKENYDDWWRCEISFSPELDELFGVTHTKQEIHPTEAIKNILSQDMEQIARELLHRVRNRFIEVKQGENKSSAKSDIEKVDYFIEPPYMRINSDETENIKSHAGLMAIRRSKVLKGLSYGLQCNHFDDVNFFLSKVSKENINLTINKNHPFYDKIYAPLINSEETDYGHFLKQLEILIFAAARAETLMKEGKEKRLALIYKENWSKILATFLS